MSIEGTITGTGTTSATTLSGIFNLSLTGFGTATVVLQRSTDGGITWGAVESFTADAEKTGESAGSCKYRLNCSAYTSGTIKYKLSQ
jgi:hypothetical protein